MAMMPNEIICQILIHIPLVTRYINKYWYESTSEVIADTYAITGEQAIIDLNNIHICKYVEHCTENYIHAILANRIDICKLIHCNGVRLTYFNDKYISMHNNIYMFDFIYSAYNRYKKIIVLNKCTYSLEMYKKMHLYFNVSTNTFFNVFRPIPIPNIKFIKMIGVNPTIYTHNMYVINAEIVKYVHMFGCVKSTRPMWSQHTVDGFNIHNPILLYKIIKSMNMSELRVDYNSYTSIDFLNMLPVTEICKNNYVIDIDILKHIYALSIILKFNCYYTYVSDDLEFIKFLHSVDKLNPKLDGLPHMFCNY